MNSYRIAVAVTAFLTAAVGAKPARGQQADINALQRLPTALREPARAIADSVSRAGLPVAVVIDKALEGNSKGASGDRILAAMRRVAADLGSARSALGASSPDELAAAASALRAGATPGALADLRRALPARTLVVPISVLGSLVAQHASVHESVAAVIAMSSRGDDATLLAFSQNVTRSISSGAQPSVALNTGVTSTPSAGHGPQSAPLPQAPKTKP